MSPIALGQYTPPPTGGKSNSFDPRPSYGNVGKPLIVVPREYRPEFVTPRFPIPKEVVIVDVVDLSTCYTPTGINLDAATVLPSVIWGAGAIVGRLKPYVLDPDKVGVPIPVKIVTINGKSGPYGSLAGLEENELQLAAAWDQKYGAEFIAHKLAEKQAFDAAALQAVGVGVGQQNGWGQQPAAAPAQPQAAWSPAPQTAVTWNPPPQTAVTWNPPPQTAVTNSQPAAAPPYASEEAVQAALNGLERLQQPS